MSTLSDSYIFGEFNKAQTMTARIAEAFKNGVKLNQSHIEEQILQIKRTHISPIADSVLTAFETGRIILVYSKDIRVPKAIPFIITKMNNKNHALIFVNNYGSLSNNGVASGGELLSISMKDLYVLMEGAFLALSYYDNPMKFKRSIALMRFTNSVYTEMWSRILNKECALSMDLELFNQVTFSVSKFYLDRVWELENKELEFNYACSEIQNPNKVTLKLIDDQYSNANIKSIDDLFTFLRNISPRIQSKVNTRYMLECYINMYRDTAILGIDTFPYLLFSITCSYMGSFIVNQPLINDIMKNKKGANVLYNELSKLT